MDWAGMMRAGLHGLGLTPEAFWRLTPWELRVMLGLTAAAAPMGRARLQALMAAYPDRMRGGDGDGRG